ncbi:MAG TPA: glucose 1-dehydrogenase, partial [Acidimicrobiales bacterium]|nr:glucose 1-dehydrogenase [Acidimicrobiales bacterium]
MGELDGLSALVTGGGTGIGLACAKAIVREGGRVAIAGRRRDVLETAAKEIGEACLPVQCDITQDNSVAAAISVSIEAHGPLRLAVNCAYQAMVGSVLGLSPDLFAMTVEGTLTGTYRTLQAEAKAMREAGGGSIVNISSMAATHVNRWMSAYGASKAGVDMLTRVAADELGPHGIRVNAILPGLVTTETASPLFDDEASRRQFLAEIPLGRLGDPVDIAKSAVFLLSVAASWITGQCLGVDGGQSLRRLPDTGVLYHGLVP